MAIAQSEDERIAVFGQFFAFAVTVLLVCNPTILGVSASFADTLINTPPQRRG